MDELLKKFQVYIKENRGFLTDFGRVEINNLTPLGQGGSGIVYEGKLGNLSVAVKFLLSENNGKLPRFQAEYININSMVLTNVAKNLHYGILKIEQSNVRYIIMKKYDMSLKKFMENPENRTLNELKKLIKDLSDSLKSAHKQGVIHRDLKPENILLSNGKFIIADFGIAHFIEDNLPINYKTRRGERLANFQFCAPEQLNNGEISFATDIYALGLIIYWFVFSEVSRGDGIKSVSGFFDNQLNNIDNAISQSLQSDSKNRPQSIDEFLEIFNHKETKYIDKSETTIYYNDRITSTFPGDRGITYYYGTDAINKLQLLLNSPINTDGFSDPIWWFRGERANKINKFKKISDEKCLIGIDECLINKIAVYRDASYYRSLVYVEFKADEKSENLTSDIYVRLDYNCYYDEEFALYNGMKVSRAEYDDNAAVRNGETIRFTDENKLELRIRYLTPYNFIIAAKFNPINSKQGEALSQQYLDDMLKEKSTFEEFIEKYIKLDRNDN